MTRLRCLASVAMLCFALSGCATRYIKPTTTQNPAPAAAFSQFDRYEVKPLQLAPAYAAEGANQKAFAKIDEHWNAKVVAVVNNWNQQSAKKGQRTLVIEPRVEHLKFINGGARFWVGAMAGSSAVIMKVKYIDQSTGKVVAEPEFFQRAAAMSGAWTMGAQDNLMLERIVDVAASYNNANYARAVGGASGATAEMVNAQ